MPDSEIIVLIACIKKEESKSPYLLLRSCQSPISYCKIMFLKGFVDLVQILLANADECRFMYGGKRLDFIVSV
jgi:hypothetical protein